MTGLTSSRLELGLQAAKKKKKTKNTPPSQKGGVNPLLQCVFALLEGTSGASAEPVPVGAVCGCPAGAGHVRHRLRCCLRVLLQCL